jgi:hypothetical protein
MISNAERAVKYFQRAGELFEIAATVKDPKAHQILIDVAEDYRRMADQFSNLPESPIFN